MLSQNAITILEARYLMKNDKGKIIEKPDELFMRVATTIAQAEAVWGTDTDVEEWTNVFYSMMSSLEFLPNSPTLMNAGTGAGTLSACFIVPIDDTMSSHLEPDKFGIMDAVTAAALIQKFGGGVGFAFSRLRGIGSPIRTTHGKACGPVGVLHELNETANLVTQGGKRKGANMGVLRVDHPDIVKFINCKKKHGVLMNFNISVGITDEFMQAVVDSDKLKLRQPHTGEISEEIDARQLYDDIVKLMHANGEPGVIFLDTINKANVVPHMGDIEGTNPCGEIPLLPFESCNLGNINLALHVTADMDDVDWAKLEETVTNATRFMDNVIEANSFPMPQIEEATKATRKIGLGVCGFADMLSMLDIPYDSPKGIRMARRVMEFVRKRAHKASEDLAEVRGPFPAFKKNRRIRKPRRNSTLTSCNPTGSISKIMGVSAGIEPHFGIAFEAHILDGETLRFVAHSLSRKIDVTDAVMDAIIEKGGSVRGVNLIPKSIQKVFPIAEEVSPEWHIKMQAAFQEHTDNAVSKTINLPTTATVAEMKDIISSAYLEGCKGLTVYRMGSRPEQVIQLPNGQLALPEDLWVKPLRRPKETIGKTRKFKVGQCGVLYVTVNRDPKTSEIVEIFAQPSSEDGGCQSTINALNKMTSLMLRCKVKPEYVAKKLRVQACHACGTGTGADARSCPDAMYRMLIQELGAENEGYRLTAQRPYSAPPPECPACGKGVLSIRKGVTCRKCNVCGYETCGG